MSHRSQGFHSSPSGPATSVSQQPVARTALLDTPTYNRLMSLAIGTEPVPLRVDAEGTVRVGRTRVTLDTVVAAFTEGLTAEEIAQQYPSVSLSDDYAAIAYYLRHQDEVRAYLREREKKGAELRTEAEARSTSVGFRERLLARRSG